MASTAPSAASWRVTDDIERIEDAEDDDSEQDANASDTKALLSGTSVNTLNTFNAVAVRTGRMGRERGSARTQPRLEPK